MRVAWEKRWFSIRDRMGYSDICTMRFRDPGQDWKIRDFAHRNGDGYGVMCSILLEDGVRGLPKPRPLEVPAKWQRLPLLLKGLRIHPRLKNNPWKYWNFTPSSSSPETVGLKVMDRSATAALNQKAKSLGVSPGFLIMFQATQWLEKNLFHGSADTSTWMCPVDMRGGVKEAKLDDMCVSFVPARFTLPSDERSLSSAWQEYRAALKRGDYWAIWELAQVGRIIGEKGMEMLARSGEKKTHWAGTYSDLGRWDFDELYKLGLVDREWKISPPGSPTHPIGIVSVEWCGHRNIGVKVHPCVTSENPQFVAQKLLDQAFS